MARAGIPPSYRYQRVIQLGKTVSLDKRRNPTFPYFLNVTEHRASCFRYIYVLRKRVIPSLSDSIKFPLCYWNENVKSCFRHVQGRTFPLLLVSVMFLLSFSSLRLSNYLYESLHPFLTNFHRSLLIAFLCQPIGSCQTVGSLKSIWSFEAIRSFETIRSLETFRSMWVDI